MSMYSLEINPDLCFGCFTCEVACKQENGLPAGINWIKVITDGPREVDGRLLLEFSPTTCRHCRDAACLKACPENGAIVMLPSGAVVIDASLCIGCMACIDACPFRAIDVDRANNVAVKCNLCRNLIEQGQKPSCVKHCPSGCLKYSRPK